MYSKVIRKCLCWRRRPHVTIRGLKGSFTQRGGICRWMATITRTREMKTTCAFFSMGRWTKNILLPCQYWSYGSLELNVSSDFQHIVTKVLIETRYIGYFLFDRWTFFQFWPTSRLSRKTEVEKWFAKLNIQKLFKFHMPSKNSCGM